MVPSAFSEDNGLILCYYKNVTERIQIIRVENSPKFFFEKVVFPHQRLLFIAVPDAILEIYSSDLATSILAERICCDRLRVIEEVKEAA